MDTEAKKTALRHITYGLYILTAREGDEVAAATVTWLSQASFTPPLVMVCIRNGSGLHAVIERSRAFAVGVVGTGQEKMAEAFFGPSKLENGRLNDYAVETGPATGAPLLVDLPYWFEARVTHTAGGGDHTVYLAEVVEAGVRDASARSLVLADTPWSYGG